MLSDKIVKELEPRTEGHQWIKPDHEKGDNPEKTCRGFGVKVMQSGRKTYVVSYRVNGKEREFVIGPCSAWKCAAARAKAHDVRKLAKAGKDPQAERVAAREAPTVRDLCVRY